MSLSTSATPYGLTGNDRPIPGGFTGTIPEFLEWLQEHLAYGGVKIGEPEPHPYSPSRMMRRVRLWTGGYSDDEALLGRVHQGSFFSISFWESTHRGGEFIYLIPVDEYESSHEATWLAPPTDVFEAAHRARELVVQTASGDEISLELPFGARMSFQEPGSDMNAPAGILTVTAVRADDPESYWAVQAQRSTQEVAGA